MKWVIIILTALIVGGIYACTPTKKPSQISILTPTKKPNQSPTSTPQKLVGSWTMYKEICCGRRNAERTGDQMQYPKQLVFTSDSKVTITNLKTKTSKTVTYQLERKQEDNKTTINYINFNSIGKGILTFENNELIVDYSYMDLQKEFYRKEK